MSYYHATYPGDNENTPMIVNTKLTRKNINKHRSTVIATTLHSVFIISSRSSFSTRSTSLSSFGQILEFTTLSIILAKFLASSSVLVDPFSVASMLRVYAPPLRAFSVVGFRCCCWFVGLLLSLSTRRVSSCMVLRVFLLGVLCCMPTMYES